MCTLDVQIPVVKWIYPCLESIVNKFSLSTLQGTNTSHREGRGKSSSKSSWKGLVLVRLTSSPFLIHFVGDLDIPNTWGIIIDLRHPPNRELYVTEGLPNGLLGYPYFGEPSHHLLNCSELIIWYVGFILWISPTNSSFPIKWWRGSDIKSLKPRFWCFGILECKTYQKDRYHNFQTGTSGSEPLSGFNVAFFEGRWHLQCETSPFLASQNWNFCESCETCRDQTSPKSFESQKPTNTMEHGIIY